MQAVRADAATSSASPTGWASHDAPSAALRERDYIVRNRAAWEQWTPQQLAAGREAWQQAELRWGIWGIGESELQLFSGLAPGAEVVELGCGTAAISAWLARHEFRATGVDFVRSILEAAAEFEREFDLWFPLLCANAEELPFDRASFDCAVSEYGASLWCDPMRWIPEASRLLRVGGRLIFVTVAGHLMSCAPDDGGPAGYRLVRDYFSRHRVEFPVDSAVEFHLPHGEWVRLLRKHGFVLDDVIETRPPSSAKPRFQLASLEWARRWPSEEIWVASKVAGPTEAGTGPDVAPSANTGQTGQ